MDRLDELATFVRIVEEGSLVGAARKLRRSPPAVTRSLAALEARIGLRLLDRTTRRMVPTEAGRNLVEPRPRRAGRLRGGDAGEFRCAATRRAAHHRARAVRPPPHRADRDGFPRPLSRSRGRAGAGRPQSRPVRRGDRRRAAHRPAWPIRPCRRGRSAMCGGCGWRARPISKRRGTPRAPADLARSRGDPRHLARQHANGAFCRRSAQRRRPRLDGTAARRRRRDAACAAARDGRGIGPAPVLPGGRRARGRQAGAPAAGLGSGRRCPYISLTKGRAHRAPKIDAFLDFAGLRPPATALRRC